MRYAGIFIRATGLIFPSADWEVGLGVVGDVFFQSGQKSWMERLFWQLLKMLEISNTTIGSHQTLFAVYHTCRVSCGKLWLVQLIRL